MEPGSPGGKLSKASQEVMTSFPIRSSRPSATRACAPPQSFITKVTSVRSSASRNSATSRATPRIERSASGFMGRRWPPSGRVGTTHRWSERRSATTCRHSEPSMATPCSRTTAGPSPPVSWYSTGPAESWTWDALGTGDVRDCSAMPCARSSVADGQGGVQPRTYAHGVRGTARLRPALTTRLCPGPDRTALEGAARSRTGAARPPACSPTGRPRQRG